jgi:hypothetical protein
MDVDRKQKVQGGVRLLTWFDPDTYSLTAKRQPYSSDQAGEDRFPAWDSVALTAMVLPNDAK